MRALATIRKIDSISPIENADAIDVAAIGGWNVVVKKGAHTVGELVVYFEIDSWIPTELAPFLSKGKEPREFEEVKGERLRTVKLRGVVSQGLILSIGEVFGNTDDFAFYEDQDVTETLNVKKYEKPVNANLAGIARGNFPSFIPKTDQERIQNMTKYVGRWNEQNLQFEVSEKVDGSSCTIYRYDRLIEDEKDPIGVCSRNLDLKETEGNSFWIAARKGVIEALEDSKLNIAIQGELAGEGIQGNQYKIIGHKFFVFDIYDIDTQTYYSPDARREFCAKYWLNHVPVVYTGFTFFDVQVPDLLAFCDGGSIINQTFGSGNSQREGLVFKCLTDPSLSFKVISNKWLLKNED
jgi:RNA ligase (TIGR02306 family)